MQVLSVSCMRASDSQVKSKCRGHMQDA
eukprot:COSAG06_NODE_45700_length_352_cov_2.600791_2_plen_27_part_01